jgi:predicted transcriptional regulator
VERVPGNSSFTDLIRRLIHSQHNEFFVVKDSGELLGSFSLLELRQFLKDEDYLTGLVIAADLAHPPPVCLYPEDNLDLVMHHFGRFNVDELPVLESAHSKNLVGAIHRKDVIDAYNREIFKNDLAGGMHSVVTAVSKDRAIELAEGYALMEIEPPSGFSGKSLRELNIRQRYGIEVILIRTPFADENSLGNRPGIMPNGDYRIAICSLSLPDLIRQSRKQKAFCWISAFAGMTNTQTFNSHSSLAV